MPQEVSHTNACSKLGPSFLAQTEHKCLHKIAYFEGYLHHISVRGHTKTFVSIIYTWHLTFFTLQQFFTSMGSFWWNILFTHLWEFHRIFEFKLFYKLFDKHQIYTKSTLIIFGKFTLFSADFIYILCWFLFLFYLISTIVFQTFSNPLFEPQT